MQLHDTSFTHIDGSTRLGTGARAQLSSPHGGEVLLVATKEPCDSAWQRSPASSREPGASSHARARRCAATSRQCATICRGKSRREGWSHARGGRDAPRPGARELAPQRSRVRRLLMPGNGQLRVQHQARPIDAGRRPRHGRTDRGVPCAAERRRGHAGTLACTGRTRSSLRSPLRPPRQLSPPLSRLGNRCRCRAGTQAKATTRS